MYNVLQNFDSLPDQTNNSGKFLTTDGTDASWADLSDIVKISSLHYPSANDTTITLTSAQSIPSNVNKYTMSVYRNGIYLNNTIDYGFNSSTKVLTFNKPFGVDEIVTVVFNYFSTDSQTTFDLDIDQFEAGNGITFTDNPVTNKIIISAGDTLPSQTNNSGKFLTTDGSTASWATVDALPTQTNNNGKFLTTDGTSASWADVLAGEVRVSSSHYPTANTNTITLTSAQTPASDITKWGLSVYRDGIFLINGIDYTYAANSRTLTFTNSFDPDEVISVNFSYISSDSETIWEVPTQTGQSGKFLTTDGSAASWADIPTEVDNQSVTLNSSDQIQAIGVIDQNTSAANKIWTGTKAEYDAIATKDPNTTYRTTDENETVYQNSYRIGQVLPSILPISDYGLHLLDGAVIDGTGIYSSFYSYIAGLVSTYPNLFISEADWQTAVTTYGVCGKFVYDSTNQTIRLPKITGIIEGTPDVTALGDLVQAGLPNITGGMSPTGLADVSFSYGAFYDELNNTTDYQANTRGGYGVRWGFNAARSSSIYGNSNTVQPQTIKVYYYIVIANSYQTPTGVQISKVATDLNGKVNLNSSWGMPSNTYTELSIPSSGSYIQAPSDGYLVFFGNLPNGSRFKMQANADIDNPSLKDLQGTSIVGNGQYLVASISVAKGQDVGIAMGTLGTDCHLRFVYAKGSEPQQ